MGKVQAAPLAKAQSSNSEATSFAALAATLTEPEGTGVHDLTTVAGGSVPERLFLMFYGVGADNDTFGVRVTGWRRAGSTWVPVLLCELAVTLGTAAGVEGGEVLDTEAFADKVALVMPGSDTDALEVFSPEGVAATAQVPAHAVVDTKGCEKVQFTFDLTGTTTSCNLLWAPLG